MNPYSEVLSLLLSPASRFFSTRDEYLSVLLAVAPDAIKKGSFFWSPPTYKETVEKEFQVLKAAAQKQDIQITTDFASPDIEQNSIAYHRIKGMILAESRWYFSSKQFEQDLLAADANPAINIHFLHITSGGGEAWYLDQLSKTLASLNKPIYTLVEKVAASAAYYIGVHGNKVNCLTQNDLTGSIGTMVGFWSFKQYFEKLGITEIEEYADRSDLKNKKYRDLEDGKPEQFIKEELNPLQQQFEAAVRAARPQLNQLPDDDPVFRGETFYTHPAIDKKLVDGIVSFPDALLQADAMGREWAKKNQNVNTLYSYL